MAIPRTPGAGSKPPASRTPSTASLFEAKAFARLRLRLLNSTAAQDLWSTFVQNVKALLPKQLTTILQQLAGALYDEIDLTSPDTDLIDEETQMPQSEALVKLLLLSAATDHHQTFSLSHCPSDQLAVFYFVLTKIALESERKGLSHTPFARTANKERQMLQAICSHDDVFNQCLQELIDTGRVAQPSFGLVSKVGAGDKRVARLDAAAAWLRNNQALLKGFEADPRDEAAFLFDRSGRPFDETCEVEDDGSDPERELDF
jgi:hypothetical protein